MASDLQELIAKRRAEAAAEQARAQEARRQEQERQRHRGDLLANFRLNTAEWLAVIAGQFATQLGGAAEVNCEGGRDGSCSLRYRRKAGAGKCESARLEFWVTDDGTLHWRSSIGTPAQSSMLMQNANYQTVRTLAEQFLARALAE